MNPQLSVAYLKDAFPNGGLIELEQKKILARPHQKVSSFYWLMKGTLHYYTELDHKGKGVLVSKISEPFMPVGWGGFNPPSRFGLKIRVASKKCTLYQVDFEEVKDYLAASQDTFLLQSICSSLYHQLGTNLSLQGKTLSPQVLKDETNFENYFISPDSTLKEVADLFKRSPFLSRFPEEEVEEMTKLAQRRDYERGEVIVEQGQIGEGLCIMIQGEVAIRRVLDDSIVNLRGISSPGFIFGWSSLLNESELCEAITTTKTSIYFLDKERLFALFTTDKGLSGNFYFRLIWLIGNHLNVAFTRYLNLKLSHNILAVENLISNAKSRLLLSSELNQVPHLLNNLQTKRSGFQILHQLNKAGRPLEKHIASIALDLLQNEEKELDFIYGLAYIYETVAENQTEIPATQIRKACAQATRELFKKLRFSIKGKENLPNDSGHIFIYNHLLNPPEYTLGNNFQITLDSHFISGLILDPHYDKPGIRTVRIGKGQEYGHQDYYEKLGYINVYTKDSDNITISVKEKARSIFYRDANKHLDQGFNLIISPEGTSYPSEESPGPFKTGAFRLAMMREKRTLLVPIVLRNFDKRIEGNEYKCKILKPIDLKKELSQQDETELKGFIDAMHDRFVKEVNDLA
ncbi:MAG: cyclic nucleotide-binding domain-containing protein [Bacteroidota bacterium]